MTTVGLRENKELAFIGSNLETDGRVGVTFVPSGPRAGAGGEDLRAQASVLGLSSAGHVQQAQQQLCGGAGCRAVSWFQGFGLAQAVRVGHAAL